MAPLSGAAFRLAEELTDDGIKIDEDDAVLGIVLAELDYARRVPVFEGRRSTYGSILMPPGTQLDPHAIPGLTDVLSLEGIPRHTFRTFADGRSSFVVNHRNRPPELACFDRPVQYEAQLVQVQESTDARIVQRSAVTGQVRLFTEQQVVAWNGHVWAARPTARALRAAVAEFVPDLLPDVVEGLLDFTVHWLSPSHIGATLVADTGDIDWESLDVTTKSQVPALSITNPSHFAALFAALSQHDLATMVDPDGRVVCLGIGLRSSRETQRLIDARRGMRHRSAQWYSYDHPSTAIVVVSADGPVTIFRRGEQMRLEPNHA